LEAIEEVLPKVKRKIIIDELQKNLMPLFNFSQEVKK